ncbi:MAG: HAD family hydrolase [Segetibacter sp.]
MQYTAAIQQNSEHHIAHGVLRKLKEKNLPLWKSENFKYIQGVGVTGTVNGKSVVAAGPNYFKQNSVSMHTIPDTVDQDVETVNFVLIDNAPVGIITLADSIRETAAEAISELKRMGIKSFTNRR